MALSFPIREHPAMGRGGVGSFFAIGGLVMAGLGAVLLYAPRYLEGIPIPQEAVGIVGTVFLGIGAIWTVVGLGVLAWYRSLAKRARAEADLFRTGPAPPPRSPASKRPRPRSTTTRRSSCGSRSARAASPSSTTPAASWSRAERSPCPGT
jgi:hypothetical protein